jgi:hypothetical protein
MGGMCSSSRPIAPRSRVPGDAKLIPSVCSQGNCERRIKARGLCAMHCARLVRTGTLRLSDASLNEIPCA